MSKHSQKSKWISLFSNPDCSLCARRILGTACLLSYIGMVVSGVEHSHLTELGILGAGLIGTTALDTFSSK